MYDVFYYKGIFKRPNLVVARTVFPYMKYYDYFTGLSNFYDTSLGFCPLNVKLQVLPYTCKKKKRPEGLL